MLEQAGHLGDVRQHALGPYPIDPNLIANGVPPDDRVDVNDKLFGPLLGTPPPGPATAAPSSFGDNGSHPDQSVAVAHYDPQTGQYATPDGQSSQQTDLVDPAKSWQDLVFREGH